MKPDKATIRLKCSIATVFAMLCVSAIADSVTQDSFAFPVDTRGSVGIAAADSGSFLLDTRGGIGMSASGVSDSFVVDTRTARTMSIAVSGPASVAAGTAESYTAVATYANGAVADVSGECEWCLDGIAPEDGDMYGRRLVAGNPALPVSGSVRATYLRPEGRFASPPLPVTITSGFAVSLGSPTIINSPGGWDVSVRATASGGNGTLTYQWLLDEAILSGATGDRLVAYHLAGSPGTRQLAVRVTDDQNKTALIEQVIVLNKPLVPFEPPIQYPVRDPVGGDILDSSGGQFSFQEDRIAKGLVVVTHGLWSAGTESWLQTLAGHIDERLDNEGQDRPNICIFDWQKNADPGRVEDAVDFYLKYMPTALPSASINMLASIMRIHASAVAEGKALANWIHTEIEAGHISPTAPLHLIGHSAGGFVMGECAYRLKVRGLHVGLVQVTTLDTPFLILFPFDTQVFHMSLGAPSVSRIERYHARFPLGLGWIPGSLAAVGTGPGVYERSLWKWFVFNGHTWVREWYDEDTTDFDAKEQEQDGFYYSPFMKNGFPNMSGGGGAAKELKFGAGYTYKLLGATEESLPDFETFGAVLESAGLYQITEEANAGLLQNMVWPVGAQSVTFKYRFASPGDGDYLVVYGDTNGIPLFLGADMELSRGDFIEGEAPVVVYGGTTNRLTFMLVSRGETNAVLEIKDIQLTISDDPDGDGLTTTEETAFETDPLRADTDGDGLGDYDELNTYFTNPRLADSDEDGVMDSLETMAGTNPNDMNSAFVLGSGEILPGGIIAVSWQGVAGKTYRVNRCADLLSGAYNTIATGVPGVVPTTTVEDTNGVPQAFYWVELEP